MNKITISKKYIYKNGIEPDSVKPLPAIWYFKKKFSLYLCKSTNTDT